MAGRAALLGVAYGLLPIGWIVLNVMFLYRVTEERGVFLALQRAITGITTDRRLQLLLIAFCFGAFFEGAAGFGTPVAVTGAMLIGIGFPPLEASALSLIANTAPVAFGALGTPVIALQGVTGMDLGDLSAMIGRQLPIFSVIVPFWLIAAYSGFRGMLEVWPALLVAGVTFAVPQFLVSNYHGPWLVDIVAAGVLDVLSGVLSPALAARRDAGGRRLRARRRSAPLRVAIMPWVILTVIVFAWGTPQVKSVPQPHLGAEHSDRRSRQDGAPHAAGRRQADAGSGGVHLQLAVGVGNRDSHLGDRVRLCAAATRRASSFRNI